MIVKTIRAFTDLEAKKIRKLNEEFEVSKARYEEILKVGKYVEEVKAPNKKKGD